MHTNPPDHILPHVISRRIERFADERPIRIDHAIHFIFRCVPLTCIYNLEMKLIEVFCPVRTPEILRLMTGNHKALQLGKKQGNCHIQWRSGTLVAHVAAKIDDGLCEGGLESLVQHCLECGLSDEAESSVERCVI
jgi:hypothetical protein